MASIGKSSGGALLAAAAMAASWACAADPLANAAGPAAPQSFVQQARELLHDGTSRLEALLAARIHGVPLRDRPDWLYEQADGRLDRVDFALTAADSLQLVVQQDRSDGPDLLTLRYPLNTRGAWRAYAGAGINHSTYFADSVGGEPAVLSGHNRHRSTGAAAELGARLRFTERLMLDADVRWIEIDPRADLLRTTDGLVGADPVSFGVRLGWQFR